MTPIDPAKLKVAQRLNTGIVPPLASARVAPANEAVAGRTAQGTAAALRTGLTAGTEAPVDTDRVSQIRKAIAEGSYPLTPTKIADAMIAAQILLRTPR